MTARTVVTLALSPDELSPGTFSLGKFEVNSTTVDFDSKVIVPLGYQAVIRREATSVALSLEKRDDETALRVRVRQLEHALRKASYALFQVKRMVGVTDAIREHVIVACRDACEVIDYEPDFEQGPPK